MRINYRTFRRVIFSLYIFITIVFCLLLLYIGKSEIRRARLYTESERNFAESLYSCREILNNVEHAFYAVSIEPSDLRAVNILFGNVGKLKDSVNKLKSFVPARDREPSAALTALEDKTRLLLSTVNAFIADLNEGAAAELNILAAQDVTGTAAALTDLRANLQTLLRSEMENVGTWQGQSVFFFPPAVSSFPVFRSYRLFHVCGVKSFQLFSPRFAPRTQRRNKEDQRPVPRLSL